MVNPYQKSHNIAKILKFWCRFTYSIITFFSSKIFQSGFQIWKIEPFRVYLAYNLSKYAAFDKLRKMSATKVFHHFIPCWRSNSITLKSLLIIMTSSFTWNSTPLLRWFEHAHQMALTHKNLIKMTDTSYQRLLMMVCACFSYWWFKSRGRSGSIRAGPECPRTGSWTTCKG